MIQICKSGGIWEFHLSQPCFWLKFKSAAKWIKLEIKIDFHINSSNNSFLWSEHHFHSTVYSMGILIKRFEYNVFLQQKCCLILFFVLCFKFWKQTFLIKSSLFTKNLDSIYKKCIILWLIFWLLNSSLIW